MQHTSNTTRWWIASILGISLILLAARNDPLGSLSTSQGGCTTCKSVPPPGGGQGLTLGQPSCPVAFTWGGLDGICNQECVKQTGCKFFVSTDCSGLSSSCCWAVGYIINGVLDAWFCDGMPHPIGPDFPCDGTNQLISFGVGTAGPACTGTPDVSNVMWFTCNTCQ